MAVPGSAIPFQRSVASAGSADFCGASAAVRPGKVTTFRSWPRARRRGELWIVRPPFSAGSLAKHAAQSQEDEHRERQKDYGVDVKHVSHVPGQTGLTTLL